MVFALVYENVYNKTTKRAARVRVITLANGKTKIVRISGDDGEDSRDKDGDAIQSLFSSPAMPIQSVETKRGWILSNISYSFDAAECEKQFNQDETLAQTLERMKDGESLREAMERRGVSHKKARPKVKGGKSDKPPQMIGPSSGSVSRVPLKSSKSKSWTEADSNKERKGGDKGMRPNVLPSKSCLKAAFRTHVRSNRSPRRRRKSLKFGNVEIRFYGRTLGDNPACSSGPPISLSWLYRKQPTILGLDEFEAEAQQARAFRDDPKRFSLSARQRIDLLESMGYAYKEIVKATAMIKRDQILREQTIHSLKYIYLEESLESCKNFCHATTNIISCKARQERKFNAAA